MHKITVDKLYKWKPVFSKHPDADLPVNEHIPNTGDYDSDELINLEEIYKSEMQEWFKNKSPKLRYLNIEFDYPEIEEFF